MKILRRLVIGLAGAAALALLAVTGTVLLAVWRERSALAQLGPRAPTVEVDGLHLRDLDKNGRIDPYEDFRVEVDERVEDLLGRMTTAEKVGLLLRPPIFMERSGGLVDAWGGAFAQGFGTAEAIAARGIVDFDLQNVSTCRAMAKWQNRLQRLAERTRLGIPVTVRSTSRHGAPDTNRPPPSPAPTFSRWPGFTGLAAAGDLDLARRLGEIARQEYRGVGIRATTAPPTAPHATRALEAYLEGFRGDPEVGSESVLLSAPGTDAADEAARERDDGVAVSAGDILREAERAANLPTDDTRTSERYARALAAGSEQLGGTDGRDPEPLIELVRSGTVSPDRIDAAARRILRDKFRLGLFDEPYVDADVAADLCDRPAFREAARDAQRRSIVLLQNDEKMDGRPILPLPAQTRIYAEGIDPSVVAHYATVAPSLEEADVALVRVPRTDPSEMERLRATARAKPTIVALGADDSTDPTVLTPHAAALLLDFGVGDEALLDVVFGRFAPTGKLPLTLPPTGGASAAANAANVADTPAPEKASLRRSFPAGFGLTYPS